MDRSRTKANKIRSIKRNKARQNKELVNSLQSVLTDAEISEKARIRKDHIASLRRAAGVETN